MMNKYLMTGLTCSALLALANAEPVESVFFHETIDRVDKTVNLVDDYLADGADRKDDSAELQRAIDDLTKLPHGGKIVIPRGTFHFFSVALRSNVHLEIASDATIVPTRAGTIFSFGRDDAVRNASIRGSGGRFTVDLSSIPAGNIKAQFANFRNVDNFMIADFNIRDNFTRLSALTFNVAEQGGTYFRPRNGVIKNGNIDRGHFGYGLIQAQAGYHLLFKDLSGTGGITLRLETGAVTEAPPEMNLDQIFARNISITNGHGGTMMGSHVRQNGHVDIDGVRAVSSVFASSVGVGFATPAQAAKGYKAGRFASSSVVKNVHAVFGVEAQLKPKNFEEVPAPLRHLISKSVNPDGASYNGPSVAAARNLDPDIKMTNVTMEGFEYQSSPIVGETKKKKSEKAKRDK